MTATTWTLQCHMTHGWESVGTEETDDGTGVPLTFRTRAEAERRDLLATTGYDPREWRVARCEEN